MTKNTAGGRQPARNEPKLAKGTAGAENPDPGASHSGLVFCLACRNATCH